MTLFKVYSPTPGDALRAAAGRIRRQGWRQTGTAGPLDSLCLVASVLMLGLTPAHRDAALAALCARLGVETAADLTGWNDDNGRTVEDVLALLEREGPFCPQLSRVPSGLAHWLAAGAIASGSPY